MAKDRVHRRGQRRHGAVVALETQLRLPSHALAGVQVGEDVGAAEPVDRLLRITDDGESPGFVDTPGVPVDAAEDVRLHPVGVLVLVDERPRVALADVACQCLAAGTAQCLVDAGEEIVVAEPAIFTHPTLEGHSGLLQRVAPHEAQHFVVGGAQFARHLPQLVQARNKGRGGIGFQQFAAHGPGSEVVGAIHEFHFGPPQEFSDPTALVVVHVVPFRMERAPRRAQGVVPGALQVFNLARSLVGWRFTAADFEVRLSDVPGDPVHELVGAEPLLQRVANP